MNHQSKITLEKAQCFHCGEVCQEEPIIFDQKDFCCSGCQKVYELLHDKDLMDYYTCDVNPGISPSTHQFEFLDSPQFRNRLITFANNEFSKLTFYLPSIHCRSCLYLLENLHKLNENVIKSQLNFGKKELTVWFKEKDLSISQLANLLSKIGYEPLIQSEDEATSKRNNVFVDKKLLLKLGIAGFCTGNIMLFSFPEYLGLDDPKLAVWFGYLNLFLGSISVFYAASDYFSNVWSHLKLKKLTIEAPVLLGIVVGYSRSVYEIISHHGAGYMDSVTGLIFFLLVGKWFQQKSFDFLSFNRNYTSYFPMSVCKWINKSEIQIPLAELKVGDRLLIRNQEIIPADSILRKGSGKLDYSFVTGESDFIEIKEGNSLFAGGRHTGEMIEVEVIKDLQHSQLTQLWEQNSFKNPLYKTENWENFANKTGMYFTILLFTLAISVGVYWGIVNPKIWSNAVVSVLIIACPCALAISYPFALGHGMRWLSKFNLYFKNTQSLERFANIDTIVFDKTGTLTLHKEQSPKINFTRGLLPEEWTVLYSLSLQSTHPLSRQLKKYIEQLGYSERLFISNFKELTAKGLQGKWNSTLYQIGSPKWLGVPKEEPEDYFHSESRIYIKIGDEFIGFMDFPWENREGIEALLHNLRMNYELYLLSGDKKQAAGPLSDWFPGESHIHFEMSPMEKMEFIQSLQKSGKKVLMVGDGLNDAGALREASVGIAVSENHLQFTPASDAILNGKNVKYLAKYLTFAQFGMKVIKYSFALSVIYNLFGLSFAVQGTLSPIVAAILMPVNSLSMLLIATLGMNFKGRKMQNLIDVSRPRPNN